MGKRHWGKKFMTELHGEVSACAATLKAASADYVNARYKPTVPHISILADQPPSRFYTLANPEQGSASQ